MIHLLPVACCSGVPRAADDAAEINVFTEQDLPGLLMFDHAEILDYYFGRGANRRKTSKRRTETD